MNRIVQENINKRMKEWDVYFVKKHDSVKYCNEWCFYISDQDNIKKLRCDSSWYLVILVTSFGKL